MLLIWSYVFAFVCSAIAVLVSIPIIKMMALKYGYVDLPTSRKVHQQPMVRLGGISICIGTLTALLLVNGLNGLTSLSTNSTFEFWVIFWGSFGFFLIGLVDDLKGLSPITRLILQVGIASLVWWMGVRIDFVTIPSVGLVNIGGLSLPVTVIWLTGVVNAINWIDGLDGLAAGTSGIAALTMFIVCLFTGQPAAALFSAALMGGLFSFLYYNFNPAQIFMGDGGSYFVGFMVASVSITGLVKGAVATAILLPFVILAVPIFDMTAVILARLRHGKSPFAADKRHLHHRLLQAGLPHRFAVLLIYTLALWAGSLAMMVANVPNALGIMGATTGLLGCMSWKSWHYLRQG